MRGSISRLLACAGLVTASIAVAGIASAAEPQRVGSFSGFCSVEGTTSTTTYSFGSTREETRSAGSCVGSVNGGPIATHQVRLATVAAPTVVGLRSRGSGWIRFEGYRKRLRFGYQIVADRQMLIMGAKGSRATATLSRGTRNRHALVLEAGSQLHSD